MARLCVPFADREDVLEWMRPIASGESVVDTFHVQTRAFEGEWRMWLRILDAKGDPLREELFFSPRFRVNP